MKLLVSSMILFTSVQVWGWGDNGHRAVGKIAESRLSANAAEAVVKILGTESLARASTWADEVRSDKQFSYLSPWHFVEIPDGMTYENSPISTDGNVIRALIQQEEILRNPKASREEKIQALRLFVHFVGDIHQPLHVGNGKDQGANLCYVKLFDKVENIHHVVDSELFDSLSLSYTEFVSFINHTQFDQLLAWADKTYVEWAHESMKLRDAFYPEADERARFGEKDPTKRSRAEYCRPDYKSPMPAEDVLPRVGYVYIYKLRPIMEERILQAGVRLAEKLNQIFK